MNSDNTFSNKPKPYIKILEEPACRQTRFRYECEGRFAEIITGANSTDRNKTFPSIEIVNHTGPAFIVVSCVTKDSPYRPHPHNLVGKSKDISQGLCYFKIPAHQKIVTFSNLGIQCVKKKDIAKSLTTREQLKVDPFQTGFSHKEDKEQLRSIDLTCVRLCYQVFIQGQTPNKYDFPLDPVVSSPIYDKKAAAELSIWLLSHCSAPVTGGTEMCIVCEKVTKDDIQVRFYCETTGWEATAEFVPPEFHKQVAVVFKTPQYIDLDISTPVQVKIELKRLSDEETSKPVLFQFIPSNHGDSMERKAKRLKLNETPEMLVMKHLQAEKNKFLTAPKPTQFDILKVQPWGMSTDLSNFGMAQNLPPIQGPLVNVGTFSDKPSTSTAVPNDPDHFYGNYPQMQNNDHFTPNPDMGNDFLTGQEFASTNMNLGSSLPRTSTESQYVQNNNSYLEELLRHMDNKN